MDRKPVNDEEKQKLIKQIKQLTDELSETQAYSEMLAKGLKMMMYLALVDPPECIKALKELAELLPDDPGPVN